MASRAWPSLCWFVCLCGFFFTDRYQISLSSHNANTSLSCGLIFCDGNTNWSVLTQYDFSSIEVMTECRKMAERISMILFISTFVKFVFDCYKK